MKDNIIISALLHRIKALQEQAKPSAEQLRVLMQYAECNHPELARLVREDPVWERFQQRYNDPGVPHINGLAHVSQQLFELGFCKYLFTLGYTEVIHDCAYIKVRQHNDDMVGVACHLSGNDKMWGSELLCQTKDVWKTIDHLIGNY
ncbi:hypothetical protein ST201phi2-1p174 [Pseudomonas phage 201phi2-1]|uniref:Uncharacterized protein n=1 Tax=Pseudomonas phage 201phi2-1 TaxID=198110 RepID=B3FJ37_BP201|nr:hypothetical protein ST201phi2-1p174 [Pseudomonas phage 201phi2-1]ABY63004.1 hypothetical protein 201phi2-1p174 [Pseudomonas phage 201phi2-1]